MASYKIAGVRYLKKYAAECLTPTYAANVDAALADIMLDSVPWERVDETVAQMTLHTDAIVDEERGVKGLDMNVEIRDCFDAALFCSEHVADTGAHRGNANAACYVFEMPDMETYPNLTSVKARVTSDPYNSGGVRLAVHVADALEIPHAMSVIREGVAYVSGVVPRGERTDAEGVVWWHAQTADAEIEVASVTLKKYLFLFVGLEDYTRSRGDWLEGSAFISPTVEIVTDGALSGWEEGGEVNVPESAPWVICHENAGMTFSDTLDLSVSADDAVSRWQQITSHLATDYTSECKIGASGNSAGLNYCYVDFFEDRMLRGEIFPTLSAPNPGIGAAWSVSPSCIKRRKLLLPFVVPDGFRPTRMRLSWSSSDAGAAITGTPIRRNIWIARDRMCDQYSDAVLQKHELYTAEVGKVGDWELLSSLKCSVGDANPDGVDVAAAFHGGEVHTLLLTCFIDRDDFDFSDAEETFRRGAGSGRGSETNIDWGAERVGSFDGGWYPEIVLI